MPWVLEETFAAGGPRPAPRAEPAPPRPALPDPLGGEEPRPSTSATDRERLREQVAKFSERDARRVDDFLAALKPIYEQGILGGGPAPLRRPALVRRAAADDGPAAARSGRCTASCRASSSTRGCARRSRSTRCSSAATRSACRPSTARSSTCRSSTAAGTPTAASTRSWRRWRARSTCAAACGSEAIETAGGRVRACASPAASGSPPTSSSPTPTCCARTSCSAARAARAGRCARRCRASCSTWAPTGPSSSCCTTRCWSVTGYRDFIRTVTRGRRLPETYSTYVHAPARTEAGDGAGRAATRSRVLLPVPNLRAGVDWAREADGLRDALVGRPGAHLRARRARTPPSGWSTG